MATGGGQKETRPRGGVDGMIGPVGHCWSLTLTWSETEALGGF